MAQENPKGIVYGTTHPTTPERFVLKKKVIEEITDKQRRRLPLEPDIKAIQVEAGPAAPHENNY